MVNKIYSINLRAVILVVWIVSVFGFAPKGYAQSVQDWSEPVNLSNSGAASNPSIVADSNGNLHVLWADEFEGYKYVESTDGGTTWTAPVTVKYPFSAKAPPPVLFSDAR